MESLVISLYFVFPLKSYWFHLNLKLIRWSYMNFKEANVTSVLIRLFFEIEISLSLKLCYG